MAFADIAISRNRNAEIRTGGAQLVGLGGVTVSVTPDKRLRE